MGSEMCIRDRVSVQSLADDQKMANDDKSSPATLQGDVRKQHSKMVILPISINLGCTSNIKGLMTTFEARHHIPFL